MHSAVLIIPAAMLAQANALGESMGWGPESYTVPLSTDGETVTHYGCRADVGSLFVEWINGTTPLPDPAAQPIVDALIWSFSPDPMAPDAPVLWGREHFDATMAQHGMAVFDPQDNGGLALWTD